MGSLMMMKFGDAGSLSFPDFDKILDFTSDGSGSSTSVSVNGDTDLEYKIIVRNLNASHTVACLLNNDSTAAHYVYQYIFNNAGSISAGRSTAANLFGTNPLSIDTVGVLVPAGFIKTSFQESNWYASGTTIGALVNWGRSWNSTANVTTINFVMSSGNFTAGTRIIVYKRRVNT